MAAGIAVLLQEEQGKEVMPGWKLWHGILIIRHIKTVNLKKGKGLRR